MKSCLENRTTFRNARVMCRDCVDVVGISLRHYAGIFCSYYSLSIDPKP